MLFIPDGKAEFSASLRFIVTWSFRNCSNMLICCSKKLLLLSMLMN